ncbi:MAG TPA: hypothetical protein VJ276_03030 [Thermoanaerobaculia bacterium]|nr:hypothetical protein [Thermoanaerobaculia bacterium]
MKIRPALILLFFAFPLFAQEVTLPLATYEQLRRPEQAENITVVDTIRLTGSFKERSLSATFVGKSVGKHAATAVLQAAAGGLSIWGCSGSALVSRGDNAFNITPLGETFSVTCRIGTAGTDRLELMATRDVLAIESAILDGDLASAERNPDGTSRWTFVRQSGGTGENLAATATGHYLITLLPDETRFRYAIDVHNPNRSRRPFEVRLRSGEHLQQVDADAAYEVVDGAYRFDVPPGDITLVLTGQLTGDSFTPPVEASLQYLAIENHPIVRPMIGEGVKRISAGEVGVPIQYRGPQAFLIGKGESLRWKKTKLEALHTVSYAVSGIRHTFFVPAEGPVLGESVFGIDNQGASDVKLPLAPEPTYASIQGEPLLMTKGADGKLTVPLSAGKQEILVQHRQGIRRFFGFGVGSLRIPQLSVPATSLLVSINYPRQWVPLVQTFSTRTKVWTPSSGQLSTFLVLLIWTERVLAFLLVPRRQRWTLAISLAAAATAFDLFAILLGIADALLTVAWLVPQFKREKWTTFKTLLATAVVTAGVIVFVNTLSVQRRLQDFGAYQSGGGIASVSPAVLSDEMKGYVEEASRNQNAVSLGQVQSKDANKADYQGLPARFEIPGGARHAYFGQEMLSVDRHHAVRVLLVSSGLVWALGMLLVIIALVLLWRGRKTLMEGLRTQLTPVIAPAPVET